MLNRKSAGHVGHVLKMLGDPTRVMILSMLREGEKNVTELVAGIGLAQPAVSHHLALLRACGLAVCERRGKSNFYSLTATAAASVKVFDQLMPDEAPSADRPARAKSARAAKIPPAESGAVKAKTPRKPRAKAKAAAVGPAS